MKFKNIVFIIFLFLFIILLSNNVNAFIVSEYGVDKYYLPDLPFNEDEFDTAFLFSAKNSTMLLVQIPKNSYLGFCNPKESLFLFNSNKKSMSSFNCYTSNMIMLDNGLYASDTWNYNLNVSNYLIDDSYEFVSGSGHIYPCDFDKSYIFTDDDLYSDNTGLTWDSDFIFSVQNCFFSFASPSSSADSVFIYDNANYYCKSSFDDSYINFNNYTGYYNVINPGFRNVNNSETARVLSNILFTSKDITGDIYVKSTDRIFKNLYLNYNSFPYIMNTAEDLAEGGFEIVIMPGDFTSSEDIYFGINLETTEGDHTTNEDVFRVKLNRNSKYFHSIDDTEVGFYYSIPFEDLEDILEVGLRYGYYLNYEYYDENIVSNFIWATYGGLTEEDILQNAIDNQTLVMEKYYKRQEEILEQQQKTAEEQLETSKGILDTIKEVLSYLNPFSENFFAYKLIDLLINGLKSLFIPSDNFLSTYFNDLFNWFSDRLGFLAYPFELIVDILNRIININFSEPIIQIPEFVEPSTSEVIINARTYNLNDLLTNNTFKICHDVYFVLVDAVIIFGLVNLTKHKLEEVFTK